MRAAPPLAFTVSRYGVARVALVVVAVLSAVTTLAWWQAGDGGPAAAAWTLAATALALLPLVEARRLRPRMLRWDGMCWHVGPADGGADAVRPGRVSVVVDLGPWLLLRFTPDRAAGPARCRCAACGTTWIPVQRGGLEGLWHAIRCTLYSPPPGGPPQGVPAPPRA